MYTYMYFKGLTNNHPETKKGIMFKHFIPLVTIFLHVNTMPTPGYLYIYVVLDVHPINQIGDMYPMVHNPK